MAYHNRYDTRGASEMGDNAEQRFKRIAISMGWNVEDATRTQNWKDRIDFTILKDDGTSYTVDVKSRKKLNSYDDDVRDDIVWLELMAVNHEGKGWLYGEANLLAFEKEWGFLIVYRDELAKYIDTIVDIDDIVEKPEDAYKRVYHRKTFRGLLTWLLTSDVEKFAWDRWLEETRG